MDTGKLVSGAKCKGEDLIGEGLRAADDDGNCYCKTGWKKKSSTPVKNGTLTGIAKEWHENGQPRIKGKYLEGKKHETWTTYYPNGQLEKQINYRNY